MADKKWKAKERKVAKWFGTERNPLSGINGKHTGSDTLHETLFIEHKHRKAHSLGNLLRDTIAKARKEEKIPVVTLTEDNRKGFMVLCREEDLQAIANQRGKVKND